MMLRSEAGLSTPRVPFFTLLGLGLNVLKKDKLAPFLLSHPGDIISVANHGPDSAIDILTDERNKWLPIYARRNKIIREVERKRNANSDYHRVEKTVSWKRRDLSCSAILSNTK
jgi:hypothetical protein